MFIASALAASISTVGWVWLHYIL